MKQKYPRRLRLAALLFPLSIGVGKSDTTSILPPPEPPRILGISVDSQTKLVTLRWTSNLGDSYFIEETSNPQEGWIQSIAEIKGLPTETSTTFQPNPDHSSGRAKFFRVLQIAPRVVEPTEEALTNSVQQDDKTTTQRDDTTPEEYKKPKLPPAATTTPATSTVPQELQQLSLHQLTVQQYLVIG